jgi:spore maturation protein CgeB
VIEISNRPLKIVYVGPLQPGDTCLHRMEALRDVGHTVIGIDTTRTRMGKAARMWNSALRRVWGPPDSAGANRRIVEATADPFDLLWIDKGLTILPATLEEVRSRHPRAILLSYSPDDMMNPRNQSKLYRASIPYYDLHVTTKSFNVRELLDAGARRAMMVDNGFAEHVHRPVQLSSRERERLGGPVGCIAFWEEDRERSLTYLASHGLPVRVWGPWPKRRYRTGLKVEGVAAWAEDYPRTICAFDINVAFLRKVNRDQQTTRSVEIPACGAFMLAERSSEHLRLFTEGKEAEFFGSDEELLDKCRFYLAHPELRRQIADAGRARCITGGYGNRHRVSEIIEHVRSISS